MWLDLVSNLGPLALESCVLPTALRGQADGSRFLQLSKTYLIAELQQDLSQGQDSSPDSALPIT